MLQLQNLTVTVDDEELLHDIKIEIPNGSGIGLTGQSGSGKTTILRSIMGILGGRCVISGGNILLDEKRINNLSMSKRRELNGPTIGFIPQNPMTAFDSRLRIGSQLIETFTLKLKLSKNEAEHRIEQVFQDLNLSDVERIKSCFPSELSGGMLQRIAVAVLLILKPTYILADEPTSALDADNSIILLEQLKKQKDTAGILLVSHDIEAIGTLCDKLYVIKDGQIIESGQASDVLQNPAGDWTRQFIAAYRKPEEGAWTWRKL